MSCLLKPFQPSEKDELVKLATEENHIVLHPSHLLMKDEKIAGYCSIGQLPIVMSFFSKRHCKARDSITFIGQCEDFLRAMGQDHYFTTCSDNSPFMRYMPKLGFRDLGTTHLMVKNI